MMALLDIGNSRLKWQLRQGGVVLSEGVLPTAQASAWRPDWAGQPDVAVISCVAGNAVLDGLSDRLGLSAERLRRVQSSAMGHGIVNHYRQPERLGADRFTSLVAAHRRGLGDCLVVSVGTAVCADMLTAEGGFLGGCILPGPDLMRASLISGTAGAGSQQADVEAFPRDTNTAVSTGIALALCGLVEELEARLQGHTGRPVTRLLTGGGRSILGSCRGKSVVEVENLVMEGLAWIAKDLGYAD